MSSLSPLASHEVVAMMIFGIVYGVLALALTWGAAVSLTRHRAELNFASSVGT